MGTSALGFDRWQLYCQRQKPSLGLILGMNPVYQPAVRYSGLVSTINIFFRYFIKKPATLRSAGFFVMVLFVFFGISGRQTILFICMGTLTLLFPL